MNNVFYRGLFYAFFYFDILAIYPSNLNKNNQINNFKSIGKKEKKEDE
jgi:hypothetical protein